MKSFVVLCFFCFVFASGFQAEWSETERVIDVHNEFVYLTAVIHPDEHVGERLEAQVGRVSTPGSPEYRKYLSVAELNEFIGVDQELLFKVGEWFKSLGGMEIQLGGPIMKDYVKAKFTVAAVERAFGEKVVEYRHKFKSPNFRLLRAPLLTHEKILAQVPSHLAKNVALVTGLVTFPMGQIPVVESPNRKVDRPMPSREMLAQKNSGDRSSLNVGGEAVQYFNSSGGVLFGYIFTTASVVIPEIFPLCEDGTSPISMSSYGELVCATGTKIASMVIHLSGVNIDGTGEGVTQKITRDIGDANCSGFSSQDADQDADVKYSNPFYQYWPGGTPKPNNATNVPPVKCQPILKGIPVYSNFTMKVQTYSSEPFYSYGIVGEGTFVTQVFTLPFVTANTVKQHYNIYGEHTGDASAAKNAVGVGEFIGQYASQEDATTYCEGQGLLCSPINYIGVNKPNNGDEATLDIQLLLGVASNVSAYFVSISDGGYLNEWAVQMIDLFDTTPIYSHSLSYGGDEKQAGETYCLVLEAQLAKMALLGMSIFVAAGDAGATGVGHTPASIRSIECPSTLTPQYPASSNYVTSVSATVISPLSTPKCSQSFMGEPITCALDKLGDRAVSATSCTTWTTGGGNSLFIKRPSWQTDKILGPYLADPNNLPLVPVNDSMRFYPDLSFVGQNWMCVMDGAVISASGTSASAPGLAATIALANEHEMMNGRGPLGLINPLFYGFTRTQPQVLRDVVLGENDGGDVVHPPYVLTCPIGGFKCSVGAYDAVTGLGVIDYERFVEVLDEMAQ